MAQHGSKITGGLNFHTLIINNGISNPAGQNIGVSLCGSSTVHNQIGIFSVQVGNVTITSQFGIVGGEDNLLNLQDRIISAVESLTGNFGSGELVNKVEAVFYRRSHQCNVVLQVNIVVESDIGNIGSQRPSLVGSTHRGLHTQLSIGRNQNNIALHVHSPIAVVSSGTRSESISRIESIERIVDKLGGDSHATKITLGRAGAKAVGDASNLAFATVHIHAISVGEIDLVSCTAESLLVLRSIFLTGEHDGNVTVSIGNKIIVFFIAAYEGESCESNSKKCVLFHFVLQILKVKNQWCGC